MASTEASDPRVDARRRRTVAWVVGLATLGMIFDGCDLVVYGAVVPTFLRDPAQIGHRISRDGRRARQLCAGRRAGRLPIDATVAWIVGGL